MIAVPFIVISCSEETFDLEPKPESSNILAKSGTDERDKLLELAQGLAPAIEQYNAYYKHEDKFLKKYGLFDRENIHAIKLPQHSEDFMLIVPFASKSLKEEKILIAYYKNGEKQYKLFSKKKYEKKEREKIEEGIIRYLDLIINLTQSKSEVIQKNSILKKNNCYSYTVLVDYYRCTAVVEDSCTGDLRVVYFDEYGFETNDISQGCGDQNLNEITLYIPDESGSNPNPGDPFEPDDEPIDPYACDIFDFECDESVGGTADDYQATLTLNTSTLDATQKNLVNQALSNLIKNCAGSILLNSLSGNVNVTIDSKIDANAAFSAIYNTIYFKSNESIDSENLSSELFHLYQQQFTGILDDIQRDPNHVGGSNIELEEKAFNRMRDSRGDAIYGIFHGAYEMESWMQDLEINHPDGSNITLSQKELDQWFNAVKQFQEFHKGSKDMYGKPVNLSLKPTTIIEFINKLRSKNCN